MGTRGFIGFVVRGKTYRCYVHFDSYPEGLGKSIKLFLCDLTPEQVKTMARNLQNMEWVNHNDPPSLHMAHILPVILGGKLKRMPEGSRMVWTEYAYDIVSPYEGSRV